RKVRAGIPAWLSLFLWPSVRNRGVPIADFWRRLSISRCALHWIDYSASWNGISAAPSDPLPCGLRNVYRPADLLGTHLYRPRRDGSIAGPASVAIAGSRSDPHQTHRFWYLNRDCINGGGVPHYYSASHSLCWT